MLSLVASAFEYTGLILIFQFLLILTNPNSIHVTKIISFFKNSFNIDNFACISLTIGVSVALIYILKNIYLYIYTKISCFVLQDLSVAITTQLAKKILFCDFAKVNSLSNDIKQGLFSKTNIVVWEYINQYITLITNASIIAILLLFLFIKFTCAAIIACIFIGILSFIEFKILKYKSDYQKKYFPVYFDESNKIIYMIVNAAKEIRLNNKSGYFLSKMEEKYNDLATINKKASADKVFHIYFTEISIMSTLIIVLVVLYFSSEFSNKTVILTLGTIIAVILRITPAFNRLQSSIYGINSNENLAKDILEFDNNFKEMPEIIESDEKLPFENQIELENVSYRYPNSKYNIKNINLTVKKGEFIGIVGASGCCKTTLSLIISGLIMPQKGKIVIDKTPLNYKNVKQWQNNISILSQDFSLIKDDIFEGVSQEITDKLELSEFNSNPLELSFGQKQRAALAQTIAQDKNVIILDEATSSLDVISEDKINKILLELKGKKTIISIAHRLQILKHCNRIIYMDNGEIIDIDTFQTLAGKYPKFKEMIDLSNFTL